jgi:hypothetical protein
VKIVHCAGHLRGAFEALVEGAESVTDTFYDSRTRASLQTMSPDEQLRWLCGKLWNCTDIMPGAVCVELEMPPGSTYAQAAQGIRRGHISPVSRLVPLG